MEKTKFVQEREKKHHKMVLLCRRMKDNGDSKYKICNEIADKVGYTPRYVYQVLINKGELKKDDDRGTTADDSSVAEQTGESSQPTSATESGTAEGMADNRGGE